MTARCHAVAALAMALCSLAVAGPLTPPGAPAPTMKTLDEIEPSIPVGPLTTPGDADAVYVISQPGAYHLTGDVLGVAGKSGIMLEAEDITLDLRGFAVRGVAGSLDGIAYRGISVGPYPNGSTIRDGVIEGWDGSGVGIWLTEDMRIERVQVRNNGGDGFALGDRAVVLDSRSDSNGGIGFRLRVNSLAERCISVEDGDAGFESSQGIFRDCIARLSGTHGFRDTGGASVYTNCIASICGLAGFDGGAMAINCTATGGAGFGFVGVEQVHNSAARGTGGDGFATGLLAIGCTAENTNWGFNNIARIESCVATDTKGGVILPSGGTIIDSTITGGGTSISPGLIMGNQSSAINTTIAYSASEGIRAGASVGVRIDGCVIRDSAADGIKSNGEDILITDTIVRNSSGGGIEVTGSRATIDNCRVEDPGGTGIFGGLDVVVRRTTVTNALGAGIALGNTAVVEECVVRSPATSGIIVDAASRVVNNLVQNTGQEGILATRNCRIEGNAIDLIGVQAGFNGSGIFVTNISNRIHNNSITRADWCIRTTTGFNAITENSVSGWFIAHTNYGGANTIGTNYTH